MTTLAITGMISGWWETLNLAQQFFYGVGLLAGLFSLVLAVLSFIGLEHHDVLDVVDVDSIDHGGGGIFSIKPLTGFFLGFGWAGGIALDAGASLIVALLVAIAVGGALMAVVVAMFRFIYSMRSDGTMRVADTVGATGTVYVTVPACRDPGGQVIVNFSGRQETFAALTGSESPLATGTMIRVTEVVDARTLMVEPLR